MRLALIPRALVRLGGCVALLGGCAASLGGCAAPADGPSGLAADGKAHQRASLTARYCRRETFGRGPFRLWSDREIVDARDSRLRASRPIVLVPGFLGGMFSDRVVGALRRDGHPVYVARLPAVDGATARAEPLRDQITRDILPRRRARGERAGHWGSVSASSRLSARLARRQNRAKAG